MYVTSNTKKKRKKPLSLNSFYRYVKYYLTSSHWKRVVMKVLSSLFSKYNSFGGMEIKKGIPKYQQNHDL